MPSRLSAPGPAALLSMAVMTPGSAPAVDADRALSAYIAGLNAAMPPRLNAEAVAALYAEDAVQSHPFGEPPGGPLRGRKALAEFFAMFDQMLSDWTHVETQRTVQGNRAVWEGMGKGTNKANGKPVQYPIVFVLEFNSKGLVQSNRVYLDLQLVGSQFQ